MNIVSKIYYKLCQMITPAILKNNFLRDNHRLFIVYAKIWHPYVDKLIDSQIKIFDHLKLDNKYYSKIQLTATGVLQLYIDNKVYMLPLGKLSEEALFKNYENYLLLKDSKYAYLVDYELKKLNINNSLYYCMDILLPIKDEKEAYTTIINNLKEENKRDFFNYINIEKANTKLKKHCQLNFSDIVEKVKNKQNYTNIGPMHGDLTPQNILQKDNGEVVMIDLDRFMLNGPQYIDKIHFYIESRVKNEKTNWLKLLPSILYDSPSGLWQEDKIIGYFLYRVDSEIRDYIEPTKNYKKQVSVCVKDIFRYYDILQETV